MSSFTRASSTRAGSAERGAGAVRPGAAEPAAEDRGGSAGRASAAHAAAPLRAGAVVRARAGAAEARGEENDSGDAPPAATPPSGRGPAGDGSGAPSATYRSVAKKPRTPPERTRRTPTTRAEGPNCSRAAAIASSRVAASTDRNGTAHNSQRFDLCCPGDLGVGDHRQAGQDLPHQAGQGGPDLRRADENGGQARPLGLFEQAAAAVDEGVDGAGVQREHEPGVARPDRLEEALFEAGVEREDVEALVRSHVRMTDR